MSLIICPECENRISAHADACPHCGFPVRRFVKPAAKKNTLLNIGNAVEKILLFVFIVPVILYTAIGIMATNIPATKPTQINNRKITPEEKIQRALNGLKTTEDTEYQRRMNYYKTLVENDSGNEEYKQKLAFYTQKFQEEEIKRIIEELKKIPVSEYEKNLSLYQVLSEYEPNNQKYINKIEFYSKKLQERAAEQKAEDEKRMKEQARLDSISAQFSPWDGSHRGLERIIKESMNDPDSYKHVKTGYVDKDDHIMVQTTFRGKNAFGGVVGSRVTAKFTIYGGLIEIVSQE
jgi:hypothetical protein